MKPIITTLQGIHAPTVTTQLMISSKERTVYLVQLLVVWIVRISPIVWTAMKLTTSILMDPSALTATIPTTTSSSESNAFLATSPTVWTAIIILTASNVMNKTITSSATTSVRLAASPTVWTVPILPSVSYAMKTRTIMMSMVSVSTVTTRRIGSWMAVRSVKPATSPAALTVGI